PAKGQAPRARRVVLTTLVGCVQARRADVAFPRANFTAALTAGKQAGGEHVLNAARARNARL
ncbi:MAG: hypothetical protein MO852_15775, partial [Candidatus Devosia euplotis]|nr:hypothetical protein [Candidatus Devosia euplotis]